MTHPEERPPWQQRQRRQRVTMAVLVLLVIGAGLVAAGLYLGAIGGTSKKVDALSPTPCSTTPPALVPGRVKVNVYNATGRDGLAASTSTGLRLRGFVIGAVANDPARAKVKGPALIRHGRKGSAAANLVAAQVPGAKLAVDKRTSAVVDLVLGSTFKKLGPTPSAAATTAAPACVLSTPKPVPPTVSGRRGPGPGRRAG